MKVPEKIAFALSFGVEGGYSRWIESQQMNSSRNRNLGMICKTAKKGSWTKKKETAWKMLNV